MTDKAEESFSSTFKYLEELSFSGRPGTSSPDALLGLFFFDPEVGPISVGHVIAPLSDHHYLVDEAFIAGPDAGHHHYKIFHISGMKDVELYPGWADCKAAIRRLLKSLVEETGPGFEGP